MPGAAGPLPLQAAYDAIALAPSFTDAVAHSVTLGTVATPRALNHLSLELNVTAAAAAAGDTLDVFVQTLIDQVNWLDICHFTLVLGNGGAKRYVAKIAHAVTQAMWDNATPLAAGQVRNVTGDAYRVRYTIVDGGAHGQSFTFAVWLHPG
jgi:hypothetical protein